MDNNPGEGQRTMIEHNTAWYEQIARYVMVKTPIEPADLAFVFGTQKMILPINYFRSLKNNGPRIPSSGRESCSSGKKSPATNR